MKRVVFCMLLLLSSVLNANIDYDLKVSLTNDNPSTAEGPYTVKVINNKYDGGQIYTGVFDTFKTFCVEVGEHYWTNAKYYATIDDAVMYSPDDWGILYLTDDTKKIYAAYLNGHLSGINSITAVQRSIWASLNFTDYLDFKGTTYYDAVMAVIADDSNTYGWQNVKVMNLWGYEHGYSVVDPDSIDQSPPYDRQSQLVMIVPAPGAFILSTFGVGFAGVFRRRRSF